MHVEKGYAVDWRGVRDSIRDGLSVTDAIMKNIVWDTGTKFCKEMMREVMFKAIKRYKSGEFSGEKGAAPYKAAKDYVVKRYPEKADCIG